MSQLQLCLIPQNGIVGDTVTKNVKCQRPCLSDTKVSIKGEHQWKQDPSISTQHKMSDYWNCITRF